MMRSLRSRLLVGMIGGIALVLILFSLGIYKTIQIALVEEFDTSLAATARALAASVERDGQEIEIEFDAEKMPEFVRDEHPAYFQFRLESGKVLRRSPSLGKSDLPHLLYMTEVAVIHQIHLPSSLAGRAVAIRFMPRDDTPKPKNGEKPAIAEAVILIVARDTTDLNANLQFLRRVLAGAAAVTTVVALLIATVVVRRSLRPLNVLAERIGAVKTEDLTSRIPAAGMPTEMVPVGEKINDLLVRLEAAFKRERRLTADVAHELRTPLAGIRSTAEVTLSRPRQPDEYCEALSDCLAIAKRLQTMTDNLLILARLDSKQQTINRERIDLPSLVESCWQEHAKTAQSRGITFENKLASNLSCESSREIVSMVVSNLLENAVQHTDDNSRIWVTGHANPGDVEVTLANTGCRLSQEDAAHVFDSFWRGDSARADTGIRCGLGLALVQRLIRMVGGSASASVDDAGVFAVRVNLPLSE